MIAQINKQKIAMVALAMNPARKADGFSNMVAAKVAAGMGAVAMHGLMPGNVVLHPASRRGA